MKKNKKSLNAEVVKVEKRVAVLELKAVVAEAEHNLLEKEIDAKLEQIESGADRIGGRSLKCQRRPIKD